MKNLLLLVFLIFLLNTNESKPQINKQINWVNLGPGIGSSQDHQMHFNFGFNVNWQSSSYFHSIGLNLDEGVGNGSNFTATFNYGLGYSLIFKKVFLSSIYIGPSLSLGEIEGEYRKLFFAGVGLSIYGQFIVSPLFFILPEIAIGIEPFVNYNFYESRKTNMPYILGFHIVYNINDIK